MPDTQEYNLVVDPGSDADGPPTDRIPVAIKTPSHTPGVSFAAPRSLQPPQPRLPKVGDTFLGFTLEAELGRGAFGRVFLARQGRLAQRHVALKVSAELQQEPQTLAQLQHTNIVPIYSVEEADGLQAICMPYFGGVTFEHVLRDLRGRADLPASGRHFVSTLQDRHSPTRKGGRPAPRHLPARRNQSRPQPRKASRCPQQPAAPRPPWPR